MTLIERAAGRSSHRALLAPDHRTADSADQRTLGLAVVLLRRLLFRRRLMYVVVLLLAVGLGAWFVRWVSRDLGVNKIGEHYKQAEKLDEP